MAPHQIISSAFLLLCILTQGGAVPVSDSANNIVISPQDASKPSSKQGLLEIPKNVATLIRNTIDQTLQSYLNFTTPRPDPYRPASIGNSIIGHYLLGNVYPRPVVSAPAYQPNKPVPTLSTSLFPGLQPTKIETAPPATSAPLTRKPLPANVEKVPATSLEEKEPATSIEEEKTPAPKPQPEDPSPKPTLSVQTVRPTKIHTLDTDSSISGIFNSNGLLFNSENEEDVFYIGSTKGSVVFPIETSTQAPTAPAPTTTVAAPTSTSEGAGDEDEDVEEESGTGFEEIEFKDLKASVKRV